MPFLLPLVLIGTGVLSFVSIGALASSEQRGEQILSEEQEKSTNQNILIAMMVAIILIVLWFKWKP